MIQDAVNAGIHAARRIKLNSAYKETERRLYSLPILIKKVEEDKAQLSDLLSQGVPEKSKSIVRFSRTGYRVDPMEMLDAITQDLQVNIAVNEYEITVLIKAMKKIQNDAYCFCVIGRYIENLSNREIAERMFCDVSTVYRNRKRLTRVVSIWLYGSMAV